MVGTRSRLAADPDTWKSWDMRTALSIGVMDRQLFRYIFNWSEANLTDATQRANEALIRAGVRLKEPWCIIGFEEEGTKCFTRASLRLLNAEADLVSRSFYSDGLFRLPHERQGSAPPGWFVKTLVYNGREPGILYDFPTITQEFLRYARHEAVEAGTTIQQSVDLTSPTPSPPPQRAPKRLRRKRKPKRYLSITHRAGGVEQITHKISRRSRFLREVEDEDYGDEEYEREEDEESNRRHSILSSVSGSASICLTIKKCNNKAEPSGDDQMQDNEDDEPHQQILPTPTPPRGTIIHIGWITQQPNDSFILEKDFRALQTWFTGPDSWQYDVENIKDSLRVQAAAAADLQLEMYWFENVANAPWLVKDIHALAGAIECMRSKGSGEVCFFVAASVEHVRALSLSQRALEKQTEQFVGLNFGPTTLVHGDESFNFDGTTSDGSLAESFDAGHAFAIPGSITSLVKSLGEQVQRSLMACGAEK